MRAYNDLTKSRRVTSIETRRCELSLSEVIIAYLVCNNKSFFHLLCKQKVEPKVAERMKHSDNLRLVFTAAHICKGLKSPLPKKAPFRLACKLNFTFHVLGDTVGQRCPAVDGRYRAHAKTTCTCHGEMSSIGGHRTPEWAGARLGERQFGRQSDMS